MANTPPIIPSVPGIASGPSGVASQQNPPPPPHLPPGTIVQGTVAGTDAKGYPVIQSEALQLVLGTRFPLPKQAQVAIRIDPPVTRDGMATFRILSVDGKPPAQQVPLPDSASRPGLPQMGAAQAELAKPAGVLLEVVSRADNTARQPATPPPPPEPATQAPARGVAAEVALSEGQKATAVLLRPALSVKATALLTHIASRVQVPLPVPAAALRPGLQLQVQVMPASQSPQGGQPSVPPQTQIAQPTPQNPLPPPLPPAPPTVPVTASAPLMSPPAQGAPLTPAANPAGVTVGEAPLPTPSTALPPPQFRAGYAQYARQAPAMMSSAAIPPMQGGQPPLPSVPAMQPPTPPVPTAVMPPAAAPSPDIPRNLTPQTVEQLLARAEAQPLPPGGMAAVVMGREPGGAVIAQTRIGLFTLPQVQAGAALQPGMALLWKVDALHIPQPGENLPPLSGSGGLVATAAQLTSRWSALEELSSLLHGMQSSMAAQTLQRIVPHVGGQFSSGLLFFMNVLRRGNVTEWLGRDMVEHLERMGKGDLVQRLGNDMNALRSLFAEQPQGNWQALFFPVMVDKQLHHAQMFVKSDEGRKQKGGGGGTRFIVELDLSNLGPMQMDGLVKKEEERTRFDLVVRTMTELPEQVKADIYAIFDNAREATGLTGNLQFRRVSEFPVTPLREMQEEGEEGAGGIIA